MRCLGAYTWTPNTDRLQGTVPGNHRRSPQPPFGRGGPSTADQALTQRLKAALALVDVRLIDHIVVGEGDSVSFSERGLL